MWGEDSGRIQIHFLLKSYFFAPCEAGFSEQQAVWALPGCPQHLLGPRQQLPGSSFSFKQQQQQQRLLFLLTHPG